MMSEGLLGQSQVPKLKEKNSNSVGSTDGDNARREVSNMPEPSSSRVGGTGVPASYDYGDPYSNRNMYSMSEPSNMQQHVQTQQHPMMTMRPNDQFIVSQKQVHGIRSMQNPPISDTTATKRPEHRTIAHLLRDDLPSFRDNPRRTGLAFMSIADQLSSKEMRGDRTAVENNRASFVSLGGHLATTTAMKTFKTNCSVQIMCCRVVQNSVVGMHDNVRTNAIHAGCMDEIVDAMLNFPFTLSLQSSGCAALETLIRSPEHAEKFINENNGVVLVSTILKKFGPLFLQYLSGKTPDIEHNHDDRNAQQVGPDNESHNNTGDSGNSIASSCASTTTTLKTKNTEPMLSSEKEAASRVSNILQIMKKCCSMLGFFSRFDKFVPLLWRHDVFLILSPIVHYTINTPIVHLHDHRGTISDVRSTSSDVMFNMLAQLKGILPPVPSHPVTMEMNANKRKFGTDDAFSSEEYKPKRDHIQSVDDDDIYVSQQFVHDKSRMKPRGMVLPAHYGQYPSQQQQLQQQQPPHHSMYPPPPPNQDRRGNYPPDL